MKTRFLSMLLLAAFFVMAVFSVAMSATANPSMSSPGYTPMVIPIFGTYTGASTKAGVLKFKVPAKYRVVSASATARSSSGTSPTLTVDVKTNGTSVFSSPISVTAGSIADAVLGTTKTLADEGTVSVDLAVGGTSTPTFKDITLFLFLKRL